MQILKNHMMKAIQQDTIQVIVTVLKNQKMNVKEIIRKVNSIEEGINVVGMLIKAYRKEVGIMEKDHELYLGDEEDFNFDEFDVDSLDEYVGVEDLEKTGVQFKIEDKEIMASLITDFVLSGYKVSARGNILLVESGKEKIK